MPLNSSSEDSSLTDSESVSEHNDDDDYKFLPSISSDSSDSSVSSDIKEIIESDDTPNSQVCFIKYKKFYFILKNKIRNNKIYFFLDF